MDGSKAEAAVSDSAAQLDGGRVAAARTSLARSSVAIAREDGAFVNSVDRKVKGFTADFSRKLGEDTAMYGRRDPAIEAANPAVKATFRNALASIGGTIDGEARAASDALRDTRASVRAEAADQALAGASRSQQAADLSAVDAFWSRYYAGFNAMAAELTALPSPSPSPSPGPTSGHAMAVSKGGAVPRIVHAPGAVHRLTSVGPASGTSLAGSTATSGVSTAATTIGNGGTTGTGITVIGTVTATGGGTTTGGTGTTSTGGTT